MDCVRVPETCRRVVDLTCQTRMNPEAFYHRIIDCLLPEYGVVLEESAQIARGTCLFGLGTRGMFYETLGILPPAFGAKVQTSLLQAAPPCGNTDTAMSAMFGQRYLVRNLLRNTTSLEILKRNANLILNDVGNAFAKTDENNTADFVVLVVARTGSRSFNTESLLRLLLALESISESAVILFKGDESIRTSMEIFTRADAVVMYHGAAAANLLFCKHLTLVVEITTYTDTVSKKSWRKNTDQIALIRPDLKVKVFRIPLHQVVSIDIINEKEDARDKDQYMKDARDIQLLKSDAEGIKEIILNLRFQSY